MGWHQIATVTECPPGSSLERVAAGQVVALFNVAGEFYALDGVCPHQGGPLGKGQLDQCRLSCPWHGLQFDVQSGQNQANVTINQPTFDVKVEQDCVYVNLSDTG
ncbi:MAG: ferredoxin [Planctomycetaceae bacterium]|mgnify:CR=1 FL=1|nr:ferredoxin [Planctomycetaceae bacterium]MBP61498.1 ferredoxin [Planctomycetaceae bacterium]